MRGLTVLWCALVLVLGGSLTVVTGSPAGAEPECREVSPITGQCIIYVPPPPPDYPEPPREDSGDSGAAGEVTCADPLLDREVPCVIHEWYWSYDLSLIHI